jgi:hypothetical protein
MSEIPLSFLSSKNLLMLVAEKVLVFQVVASPMDGSAGKFTDFSADLLDPILRAVVPTDFLGGIRVFQRSSSV